MHVFIRIEVQPNISVCAGMYGVCVCVCVRVHVHV